MERIVRLKAPPGVNSIAHGERVFVAEDGVLSVPESVAAVLLKSHRGYSELPPAPAESRKALKLKHG